MTTFLFSAVAVSGMAIITKGVPFTRRNRFILTAGLVWGYGGILVTGYFSNVFTYDGDNSALQGFLDAIVLIMETGFAVTAAVCMILNLTLPEEVEETEGEEEHPAGPGAATVVPKDIGLGDDSDRGAGSSEIQPVQMQTIVGRGDDQKIH